MAIAIERQLMAHAMLYIGGSVVHQHGNWYNLYLNFLSVLILEFLSIIIVLKTI